MSRINVPRMRTTVLLVGVFSIVGAGTLVGQSPFAPSTGPVDLIISKLAALQAAVEALATKPAEPSEVTLRTSAALIFSNTQAFATCNVTNVTGSPLVVTAKLLDASGAVVTSPFVVSLAAGQSGGSGTSVAAVTTQRRRCEFSFTGLPEDIRANLTINDNVTASAVMSVYEAR